MTSRRYGRNPQGEESDTGTLVDLAPIATKTKVSPTTNSGTLVPDVFVDETGVSVLMAEGFVDEAVVLVPIAEVRAESAGAPGAQPLARPSTNKEARNVCRTEKSVSRSNYNWEVTLSRDGSEKPATLAAFRADPSMQYAGQPADQQPLEHNRAARLRSDRL